MQEYNDLYLQAQSNQRGRATTTRPPGKKSWWDSLQEAFAAPATGQAAGGTAGVTTTPVPVLQRSGGTLVTTPVPVTISGAGTIQNNQLFRSDATTPRPVTISGAGTIVNNRLYRSDATTPETIGSPVDLYSAANDGSVPTTRGPGVTGVTTVPPTTPTPDVTTTPTPDEIGGSDLGEAGRDAYQRNLANILQGIDTRKQAAGEGFSDLYQQFKDQRTMQQSMTDPRGLTGGMERQEGARQSAAEIGAMTDLASQRQRAVDQIESEKMTAELQAGRMTAEQYELEKQTSPAWQQGELLAQKYNETGNIDDFNEYLTHMSGLLGIEPSLANSTNIDKAVPEIQASVKTKVNQYIQNPDMLQQITGFGGNAVATITGIFGAGKGLAALGSAFAFGGKAGIAAAATGTAAKGLTIGAAAGPVGLAVAAGVLAVVGIIGLVRNIRANKSTEEAKVEIDKLLTKERQRIIDGGFTEQEADDAIAGLRKTLPSAYQG
jgi:hypothetical protein